MRRKDPNSRSGKIRQAILTHSTYTDEQIADLLGDNKGLVYQVRKTMAGKPKKKPVKSVQQKKMPMHIDIESTPEEEEAFNMIASANDVQVGGMHYKSKAIQPWDFITSNGMGFLEGNIIKYVSRWNMKGGVEDLKKAQHYLTKLIEVNS